MKHLMIMAAAVALSLASAPAQAQSADAESAALSASAARAAALSASSLSQTYNTTYNNSGKTEQVLTGTRRLETTAQVTAPSMGSGHPCGLGRSIGLGGVGLGGSGGFTSVDEACLLANMGQGKAALVMIAGRDEEACKALRQVGTISADSSCTGAEKAAAKRAEKNRVSVSTQNQRVAAAPKAKKMWNKCSFNATTNEVNFRKTAGVSSKAGGAACYASLGF